MFGTERSDRVRAECGSACFAIKETFDEENDE